MSFVRTKILACLLSTAYCLLAASAAQARPPVEMVLLADQKPGNFAAVRHWGELLGKLGVSVQVRPAQSGDKPDVENRGSAEAPHYVVTGELTASNELQVPGGKFGPGDTEQLTKWLNELGTNGVAGVTEKRSAFGLLAKQLADVHDDLAQPIGFSTKKVPAPEAVEKIGRVLKLRLVVEPDVQQALAGDDPVRDELSELSCGTALAAIARPAGALLRPETTADGTVRYVLAKAQPKDEAWPIGWPSDKPDGKVLPQLLDPLSVEIRDVSATQAIDALAAKLKVPFVWDYNSLALYRIDLSKNISIPTAKSVYGIVLRQVLGKAGLRYSVRLDEAGKPLIWITTIRGS